MKSYLRATTILAALLGLTVMLPGCTSLEDRIVASCERLGAQPGTPEFWQCEQQQVAVHQQRAAMFSHMAIQGAWMLQPPPTVNVRVLP